LDSSGDLHLETEGEVIVDIGTAIAICGVCFSVVAIVFKVVSPRPCTKEHCQDHSGVVEAIKGVNSWLSKIDGKVDKLLRNGMGL